MKQNMADWPMKERKQAERWEEKCQDMGGDPYVTDNQLQCKVGDKELRVDKKTGHAVLESSTERLGIVRDANYIEGDNDGIKVSKDIEEAEDSIRLKSQRQNQNNRKTRFEGKLVKVPEHMRR